MVTQRLQHAAVHLALTSLVTAGGCTTNVGELSIEILRSPLAAEEPLTGHAASVRIRVEDADGDERASSAATPTDRGATRLSDVPTGDGMTVIVEGLSPEGVVVSVGRTGPLTIDGDTPPIRLFVGQIDRFSQTPAPPCTDGGAACGSDGGMGQARAFHSATRLLDGSVLLTGGAKATSQQADVWRPGAGKTPLATDTVELLDENALTFAPIDCAARQGTCLNSPRIAHTATLLQSGNVLIAGGAQVDDQALDSTEIYVPAQYIFLPDATLREGRWGHAAAASGASVALAGGRGRSTPALATVESFASGALTQSPGMRTARRDFALVTLADGTLVALGGFDGAGQPLDGIEWLPPGATRWEPAGTAGDFKLPLGLAHHRALRLPDDRVLVVGGLTDGGQASAVIALVDLARREVVVPADKLLKVARWAHTVSALPDGRILVIGGFGKNATGSPISSVEVLTVDGHDVTLRSFPDSLGAPRAGHSATLLRSGALVVAGGVSSDDKSVFPAKTAEVLVYKR